MIKFTKKDHLFYELISRVGEDTCVAAGILADLFKDLDNANGKIQAIAALEHKCDMTVHDIIEYVNHSFVTPIDSDDIFRIATVIDNIIDSIDSTAHRIRLFNITEVRPGALRLTQLTTCATKELKSLLDELINMKTSKVIHEQIVEINRIENQGDTIYRELIKELFLKEKDPIELIKWKEIYEYLEKTLDYCEDVANIIEGIVSKNA